MAEIFAQANQLVKAIRESPEWFRLQQSAGPVKADPGAERLLSEYRLKRVELQALALQGLQPSREQQAAYQSLQSRIQGSPALLGYMAAEEAYGRLLDELRKVLDQVFQPDLPGAL